MAKIADCPKCLAVFGVPEEFTPTAALACPACQAHIAGPGLAVRELPFARVVAPEPVPGMAPGEIEVDFDLGRPPALALPSAAPLRAASQSPASFAKVEDFSGAGAMADGALSLSDDLSDDSADAYAEDEPEYADAGDVRHREYELGPVVRRTRRKSSAVRTLVGIVGGGVVGLLLAGYALVWLTHMQIDFFRMADWVPAALLPSDSMLVDDDASANIGAGLQLDESRGDKARSVAADPGETIAVAELVEPGRTESERLEPEPIEPEPAAAQSAAQPLAGAGGPEVTHDPGVALAAATVAAPVRLEKPRWPATPVVADLVEARLFSLAELTEAVRAADDAGQIFLAGDLKEPSAVRTMGQAYLRLCAAAEAYTLTDPAAYGSDLITQQALAKSGWHAVAGHTERRRDLAVITARWLQHRERKNQGVLLVGRVTDQHMSGAWTECVLETEYDDQTATTRVLMDRVRFAPGVEGAIVGVIVDDPARRLAGYQGDAAQVIVAGYAFDPAAYADAPVTTTQEFALPGF